MRGKVSYGLRPLAIPTSRRRSLSHGLLLATFLSEQEIVNNPCTALCRQRTNHEQQAGIVGKKGVKRALDPEEEAKKKKRMERFGIVDVKAEAAAKAEAEVSVFFMITTISSRKMVNKAMRVIQVYATPPHPTLTLTPTSTQSTNV